MQPLVRNRGPNGRNLKPSARWSGGYHRGGQRGRR
jgi:hypothetical protein